MAIAFKESTEARKYLITVSEDIGQSIISQEVNHAQVSDKRERNPGQQCQREKG
jgi:hypothetical protein